MQYDIHRGVIHQQSKFKKLVVAAAAALAVILGTAIPAFAYGEGNSTSGIDRYNDNPGRQQATEVGAQCGEPGVSGAGSGAFGYFGGPENNFAGGANGEQTGLNNSSLCGNRQGNLP